MTRSDLINSLGVGSRLSSEAIAAARSLDHKLGYKQDIQSESDSDDSSSESEGEEDEDAVVDIPCGDQDVGSFYAAILALAKKVEIGTKVCASYIFVMYDSFYLMHAY